MLRLLGAATVAAVAMLALAWLFQRRLIYFPLGRDAPRLADALAGASTVELNTADGVRLLAWFLPVTRARATVLVFPGNAGDRADRAPLALALARRGFSVLLVDYRGYGGNPGRPTERGLYLDARAARDFVLERPEVDPDRLVYYGESLGSAVALELAVAHPPAALVLRSPFTSLVEVGRLHYPLLPVGLLLSDRYPSIDRIPGLACPLLVIAGERDTIVPPSSSRALFDAAPQGMRRFLSVPSAGHNDRALLDGARMIEAIEDFWCATPEGEDCEMRR